MLNKLNSVKAIFLDISGVLVEGENAISGAAQAIRQLRDANFMLRFVTNTATKSARELIEQLNALDIPVDPAELFTAPIAARHYLQQQGLRPFCLIHSAIKADFAMLDQQHPNCVLLGDARDDLNYPNLNRAFQLCHDGAPLIGIGNNKYFKADHQLMLDAGAFIHAISWASGQPAIIMGKPSIQFFEQIVASTGLTAAQCLMVGDDVMADVKGAIDAGLNATLVRTGKYQPTDDKQLPSGANIIDHLGELVTMVR